MRRWLTAVWQFKMIHWGLKTVLRFIEPILREQQGFVPFLIYKLQ